MARDWLHGCGLGAASRASAVNSISMMATGLQQLPVGASLDTEAAEQRMRADMWFRRSPSYSTS